jgi:hypothetical protein
MSVPAAVSFTTYARSYPSVVNRQTRRHTLKDCDLGLTDAEWFVSDKSPYQLFQRGCEINNIASLLAFACHPGESRDGTIRATG